MVNAKMPTGICCTLKSGMKEKRHDDLCAVACSNPPAKGLLLHQRLSDCLLCERTNVNEMRYNSGFSFFILKILFAKAGKAHKAKLALHYNPHADRWKAL